MSDAESGRPGQALRYRDAPQGAERRIERREKVFEPASLRLDGVDRRIHLLNLSRSGALVHDHEGLITRTADAALILREKIHRVRVSWVSRQRAGLRFIQPLSEAEIAAFF